MNDLQRTATEGSLKDVRAVLFDLFQTLIPVRGFGSFSAMVTRACTPDPVEAGLDWTAFYHDAHNAAHTSMESLIRTRMESLNVELDHDLLTEALTARRERHHYGFTRVEPQTLEAIRRVRESGRKTALLSNSDSEIVEPYSGCPLCGIFDEEIFSHEVGLAKPDPAIFHLAAGRLGVAPGECLFIGDGANFELQGAEDAGMKTALALAYANPERLEQWGHKVDAVLPRLSDLLPLLGLPPLEAP